MDLSTEYMGLKLKNPIIVSSSKLTGDINNIKKCADIAAGTGIHDYSGVVIQLLAGASATQICSTLFNNGLSYIDTILFDTQRSRSGEKK
ncbi:MAG: hypothetical protein IMY70_01890 [Bacteroidetes bacterium]|nr:hypothetical protein [Bacteroidota bacterium]